MSQVFKIGDQVRQKSGDNFSGNWKVLTIEKVDVDKVWFQETKTYYGAQDWPDLEVIISNSQHLKADSGKLQWSLVMNGCQKALLGVVKVMTVAITPKPAGRGYAKDSWKLVPEAKERYKDALYRHLAAIERGEVWDNGPEGTGCLHWDCVTTNAMFLSEFAHGEYDAPLDNKPTE